LTSLDGKDKGKDILSMFQVWELYFERKEIEATLSSEPRSVICKKAKLQAITNGHLLFVMGALIL